MCLTIRLPVSRPLVSAFDSAFLRRLRRNSADFLGQRALETPNCLPVHFLNVSIALKMLSRCRAIQSRSPSVPLFPSEAPISTQPRSRTLIPIIPHPSGIISRTLRSPSRTPSIPPHGYRLFVIDHIAQVCQCALELPAIDSLCCFTGVLEGDAEVGAVSAGGFALLDRGSCVADLDDKERISWCIK